MKERRFYVPESFQRILEKMEEILKREGTSLSKWIRQTIAEYVRTHEPGNPQQRMDRYKDLDAKPYIAPKGCGFCHEAATGVLRFKPTDSLVPLCEEHYRVLVRSPNYERTDLEVSQVEP